MDESKSLSMAYRVLKYPKLGMRLDLGAVYTLAELETRCGRRNPERRKLLHEKLKDRQIFKPVSLQTAIGVTKSHLKASKSKPEWVKPPAIQPRKDDKEEVGRRRLVADGIAKELLRCAGDGPISDKQVLSCLRAWGFYLNSMRTNVIPEGQTGVFSDTLGLNKGRDGRVVMSSLSRQYPNFTRLLTRWFQTNKPSFLHDDFPFTSISVNSMYAAKRHRDKNNCGPSVIKTFGQFRGGELRYWPEDSGQARVEDLSMADSVVLSVKTSAKLFDGKRAHEVNPFSGAERFSLVFFTVGKYSKAASHSQSLCKDLEFKWPTDKSLQHAMAAATCDERDCSHPKRRRTK
eukprot:gnl/MRDRNA2_/MRDRNA2_56378_c1_seq1.p1 gnl/MRDRNA2_/MRDRNA2_56378_c1~~gnl/MRDRNA2_/MRDRNA2_56378_c1_seq1.p1  ORF type:complete len:346 (+),score=55.67 gnl/MRDRNA2_/MRDRNA2_56378_c1_seq1:93-1130(+)